MPGAKYSITNTVGLTNAHYMKDNEHFDFKRSFYPLHRFYVARVFQGAFCYLLPGVRLTPTYIFMLQCSLDDERQSSNSRQLQHKHKLSIAETAPEETAGATLSGLGRVDGPRQIMGKNENAKRKMLKFVFA